MKRSISFMLQHAYRAFSRKSTTVKDEGCVYFEDDWELIEVLDQEFGSDGDGDSDGDGNEGDEEMYLPGEDEEPHSHFLRLASHNKIKYRILSKDDVRHILSEKISKVSTVLSLSRSEAVALLIHFNWNVMKVHEKWLTSEAMIRKDLGLHEKPVVATSVDGEITCTYCYERRVAENMDAASCGHRMCLDCWTEYVSDAINEGSGCLTLLCPEESCEAAVGIELLVRVSSQDDRKKLDDYLLKSYVNSSRKAKWCPASGCEFALCPIDGYSNNEVTCKCLHNFCWNCSKEAHAPLDCTMVNEWKSETLMQSNNWLLAKARPCPGCEIPIEENSCERYSQCTLCEYTFHNDAFYLRARDAEDAEQVVDDNGGVRELAKLSLERYIQYYEGWSNSEACRKNALTDLKVLQDIRLELLCRNLDLSESKLNFLVEAHLQVVNCWRIIKWSYAFGYYIPTYELQKKNLFEFLLEQAIKVVRMLESQVDDLVERILAGEELLPQYDNFRGKIIQLTRVTRVYFERLVEASNDNLPEVVSIKGASPRLETDEASSSSSSSSPTRRVVKAEGEEGCSRPFVNIQSQVLIPGPSSQKATKLE